MGNSSSTNRIAKNTTYMSIRMIIVMFINLYSVRVLLNALGLEDYGIYNVIAGLVTTFSFASNVLSTATQRYYSYSIGEDNTDRLRNIFSVSINIYVILSVLIFIIGETVGLWFVNTQLTIPSERMIAVNFIYQFSIFSFVLNILRVPYLAATLAHEDVGLFAIISALESLLKLLSALLLFIIPYDRLILYGAFVFIIPALALIAYVMIGRRKYTECHYHKPTEKKLYKELLTFSGWTFFGSIASVGMFQVNTILVNIFFGPIVNAARAIALQINSALSSLSSSILMPIRPPMIKSYAGQDYDYLNKIFYLSNKLIYYFLLIICIPLMLEMDVILNLWLKTNDTQTILFSRIILVYAIIMSLNNPISIIIQATGRVKEYHVAVEFFTLLCVPATYILFKLGYPASSAFIVMVIAAILSHIIRMICLKRYYKPFSYNKYIKSFVLPAFFITIIAVFIAVAIKQNITIPVLRFITMIVSSVLSIGLLVLFYGLSKSEKILFKVIITNRRKK